jgi:hypothetical protein
MAWIQWAAIHRYQSSLRRAPSPILLLHDTVLKRKGVRWQAQNAEDLSKMPGLIFPSPGRHGA